MVALKLAVLALFVGVGALYLDPKNWAPFAPNGWRGIHQGAAIVFFAYIGFDAVSTAAEETKDPQRNMPRGILGSLVICTLIYAVVGLVATGLVPYTQLKGSDPLARAFEAAGLGWGQAIISFGAIVSMTRGAAGVPARPAADLLLDEPRRPAAAGVPGGAPGLPHAARRPRS